MPKDFPTPRGTQSKTPRFVPARTRRVETPLPTKVVRFGEFLISRGRLSRVHLLQALMYQDRHPSMRLGQCAVELGHVTDVQLDQWLDEFARQQLLMRPSPGQTPDR